MVMRKTANVPPHKPETPQPQVPRKKLSFREPEVVPRGTPRVVLNRADEFELDDELQVTGLIFFSPLRVVELNRIVVIRVFLSPFFFFIYVF